MARKVLITFLGTGPLDTDKMKGEEFSKREYKTAKYRIGEKDYVKSFVADALTDHFGIDTIIMIGTVKSMWEEVYKKFCEKRGIGIDENIYFELGDNSEGAHSKSPLSLPHKEDIEKVLGKDSQIVLIKYGINEEELTENISTILGLETALQSGDEIYVDVTHSFRSLPLLLMNTLIYLQNVSKKRIQIKSISYGMLEVNKELDYVPVVNLKKLLEVNDWISAAYSFSEFGNAYKISKLLMERNKDVSRRLKDFTDASNLNNMYALQKSVQNLCGIPLDTLPPIEKMTIAPVISDFIRSIGKYRSTAEFQYKLAKWQCDKHNYYAAYLTLVEAIVSYVCELCSLKDNDKEEREQAKDILNKRPQAILNQYPKLPGVINLYQRVNSKRNKLAHAVEIRANNENIKKTLTETLSEFGSMFQVSSNHKR